MVAFDVQVGQDLVQPFRNPPVLVAEQLHRRGNEQHADERGVDQDRARQAQAEQLDGPKIFQHEAAKDDDHDQRCGGNDPCRRGQSVSNGVGGIASPVVLLLHTGEKEDLVVHREPEQDREQHHGDERFDRTRLRQVEQRLAPTPLEHRYDDAIGGSDRQHVHDDCLDRDQQRTEHHHQQQERKAQHDGKEQDHPFSHVVRKVILQRNPAADRRGQIGPLKRLRHDVVPDLVDKLFGLDVLR